MANLTDRIERWRLPFTPTRVRELNHTTQSLAMHSPVQFRAAWRNIDSAELEVPPHSYLRLEGVSQ
jgi:hypothetical protein